MMLELLRARDVGGYIIQEESSIHKEQNSLQLKKRRRDRKDGIKLLKLKTLRNCCCCYYFALADSTPAFAHNLTVVAFREQLIRHFQVCREGEHKLR